MDFDDLDDLEHERAEDDAAAGIDVEERCAAELAKTPLAWLGNSMEALERNGEKAVGRMYGMEFPWSAERVKEMGDAWMTKAFHAAGSIPSTVTVTSINKVKNYIGGGACSKLLINVTYSVEAENMHANLFAKIPFPHEGETKSDRMAQSVMQQGGELPEINVSRMLESRLPFRIPKYYFGDLSHETTNWILITEQIPFTEPSKEKLGPMVVEPAYEKMMDWTLKGKPEEYYLVLLRAGGKMAGMYKAGKLAPIEKMDELFGNQHYVPAEACGMNPAGSTGLNPTEFRGKLKMGEEFIRDVAVHLFPDEIRDQKFLERYKRILTIVDAYTAEINWWSNRNLDYVAWSHGNLNVDNCFFWRDADDRLDIGVLDWGGARTASMGQKLWWWLYGCEPEYLSANIDRLLQVFMDTYQEFGGPKLELEELKMQFVLAAMAQGVGLLGAVPQIYRMCKKKEFDTINSRRDNRVADNVAGKNTLRLYVGGFVMMTKLVSDWKIDEMVDRWVDDFAKLTKQPKKTITVPC